MAETNLTGIEVRLADLGLRKTIYDKTFGFVRIGLTEKEQNGTHEIYQSLAQEAV